MSSTVPRIPPIPRDEWTEEARDLFTIMGGPAARENGSRSNLLMTLAYHPPLAKAYFEFGLQLLRRSTLPDRLREIVTLHIAWRHRGEYEWVHHQKLGREAGLSDDEIEATKKGADAGTWSGLELWALRAVDQLCTQSRIDDETWEQLARRLDRPQLLDLLFTVGHYVMLSWVLATVGLQVEPGVPVDRTGWPATANDSDGGGHA